MRYITIILLAAILSSCGNPFKSKELRHKNKCNRKLERVVKKCPELLTPDTITVEIPAIKIDTVLQVQLDTMVIDSIIRVLDTIPDYRDRVKYLTEFVTQALYIDTNLTIDGVFIHINLMDGELLVSIEKPAEQLKIPDEVIKPLELTTQEKVINALWDYWWLIVLSLIILVIYNRLRKKK